MDMKVLLTGFAPFGGESVNPSLTVIEQLDGRVLHHGIGDATIRIVAAGLPTVFGRSLVELEQAIVRHQPGVVICLGQAGGRAHITPERIAINVDDARIADNDGRVIVDQPVVSDGPAAYFSGLPIKAMVHGMREAGVPASVSNSAGTYVCNHVFYGLMHLLHTKFAGIRGGFVHIPFSPEQVVARDAPSMAIADMVKGIEICARLACAHEGDLIESGGREC